MTPAAEPEPKAADLDCEPGHPIAAKAGFGLWEWGTLWRECGFWK